MSKMSNSNTFAGESRNDHQDNSQRYYGKFASSSQSHSHRGRSSEPPTAVTPNKKDRASSKHKSKSALSSSIALRKAPFEKSEVSTSNKRHASSKHNKSAKSVPIVTLGCIAIDWLTPSIVHAELLKHLTDDESVPKSTEDQLDLLMNKFPLPELKSAYYMTMGKLGADVKSETLPFNPRTDAVKEAFITMIYDHRSMLYDGLNSRGPKYR